MHSSRLPADGCQWINDPERLRDYCRELRTAGEFGFDTEFIGERTYFPNLCLLQLCGAGRVVLVDPLVVKDLDPLGELISDPAVTKICHAGSQDIAILNRCGYPPANVLDTQLLAGLAGLVYPISYARAAEFCCGVRLDKAHTYSAWDRRPLLPSQVQYAADDVRYLSAIFHFLDQRLAARGQRQWIRELCDNEAALAVTTPDPQTLWQKIKVPRSLSRKQLGVLRELAAWRNQVAYEHNLPMRTFLSDSALRDIAKLMPRNVSQLSRIEGIARQELQTYGAHIVEITNRVERMLAEQLPPILSEPADTLAFNRYTERVWAAAQAICLGQNVCTSLVTSQASIAEWAALKLEGQSTSSHELMQGWHYECLGRLLEEFTDGRTEMVLVMQDGEIQMSLKPGI